MPHQDATARPLTPSSAPKRSIPSGGVRHVVQQGENVDSIAFLYGHLPETLWKHERNATLCRKRGDRGVLLPGDELFIPPLRTRTVTVRTGATHRFVLKGVPSRLRFRARVNGLPLADLPYVLEVGGRRLEGATDAEGGVDCPIRPDAPEATLRIGHEPFVHTYTLDLRALDPVTEASGLGQRLVNLGHLRSGSSPSAEELRAAVSGFQAAQGLEATGEADARTRELLLQVHGS